MQTFLPLSDFWCSALVLDKKRCFKQVVEAKQILCTLRADYLPEEWRESKSYTGQKWINHPAVKMWEGYEEELKAYYNTFLNTVHLRKAACTKLPFVYSALYKCHHPWWLGNEDFHRSHRARLIEKDREFYLPKFPGDEGFNDGKYLWPDNKTQTFKIIN
jgi:hypothetical protein